MASKVIDLTGRVFGRLRVTALFRVRRRAQWRCICECGTERIVETARLRGGHVRSCGCLGRERRASAVRTHGESRARTVEYQTWIDIHRRCRRDPLYVSRGIHVCERWTGRGGYAAFLVDMGRRPGGSRGSANAHSIDREDNDGHYDCGQCADCHSRGVTRTNCRWATPIRQSRNTRPVRSLSFQGKTMTLPDWAEQLGVRPATLRDRLKLGWSVEDALTLGRYVHPRSVHR